MQAWQHVAALCVVKAMRPAILSGAMALPREHVHIQTLTKKLTARHQTLGSDDSTLVQGFLLDREYIHVPRQFGLDYCARHHIPYDDETSGGFAIDFPKLGTPRDYQVQPLNAIIDSFDLHYDLIFKAHTGWGKTFGGLWVAQQFATTTIILVDQENLMEQWLEALELHCGMTIENGHVGIVQGDKCNYEGRSFVIAMVQTLSRKQYDPAFYAYFGFVIFDEVHTVGAPTFSVVLLDFPAMYRLGVSATPKRKDALQKLLTYSLGKIRVAADKEHDESAVYIRDHHTIYSWYGNISPKTGRILNEVANDGSRNLLIAESVVSLYETGRDGLLLSDRIEQLKHVQSLLYYMGVEEDQLGLYAGYDPIMRYAKEPKPMRKPNYLEKHEDGEEYYTPVSLQLISKRIPKKVLAERKANAGILSATYGMCAKGFDEKRLRFGADLTPRSEVEQIHGRILRDETRETAIWVTIRDTHSYRLLYSFMRRIKGYLKSNGRMYAWPTDGELTECHEDDVLDEAGRMHETLQQCQIRTLKDGRNIIVTPQQETAKKKQLVQDTVNRVRSRRPG